MFSIGTIDRMNADEIRKLAEAIQNRPSPKIGSLFTRVTDAIERAANKGEMRITVDPLAGLRCPISDSERKAVWERLRGRGFTVRTGKRFSISWCRKGAVDDPPA